LITGFLFLACYWQWGFSLSAVKYCVFSFLIIGLVFIDAEWKLLPDMLTLPGLVLGLAFSWFIPVDAVLADLFPDLFGRMYMSDWSWRLLSFCDSVLGAAVGAAFIFGVGFIYLHARGVEGMGFGDVKLMGMVGAFLGVKLTIFTIFAASIVGTFFGVAVILKVWMERTRRRIIRHREPEALARKRAWQSAKLVYRHYQMPFGVFLGSMALVSLFLGGEILRWYWSFYP
jgi:leader peptidase (prepilin peptidase)/N-methyltransferase